MAFLDSILNPVFQPLLKLGPFWAVLIISLVITLVTVLVYKYFTDQAEMKRLKEQQKDFQKQMKELKDNPTEMMKVQKEAMKANFDYMKHSFKATLITMLPVLILFGWMNAHLAFEPIYPDEAYSITAKFAPGVNGAALAVVDKDTELLTKAQQNIENSQTTWRMKSSSGEHIFTIKIGDESAEAGKEEQSQKILITKDFSYTPAFTSYKDSGIQSLQINYNKLRPLGDFSLFSWQPGWLGWYIIFSIVFSLGLRKLLNVY
ncbi:DUF106 domain-containing protein [Candidatus Woesearchaeota archaeon]|nr:DUF106 domain-containing protein [Candidatus Woesearchaeota archaeon]